MRATLLILAPVLLAGCAAVDGRDVSSRERDALERTLAGRVAGEAQNCVPSREGEALRAVDRRTVVYGNGRVIWVNRLDRDCPGLGPSTTLIVEPFGDRYCRLDRVRALEPGGTIPGPICPLGSFTPYRLRR
jgi:hypothetical protein